MHDINVFRSWMKKRRRKGKKKTKGESLCQNPFSPIWRPAARARQLVSTLSRETAQLVSRPEGSHAQLAAPKTRTDCPFSALRRSVFLPPRTFFRSGTFRLAPLPNQLQPSSHCMLRHQTKDSLQMRGGK